MSYELMYNEMVDQLLSNKNVHINRNDFYLRQELLPDFIETHAYFHKVKEELHALNDNCFSWQFDKDDGTKIPMGEFHFLAIEEVVGEKNKRGFTYTLKQQEETGSFFPFDDHPESGDGIMGCLKFSDTNTEVWLYTENGELFRMNLSLSEYLLKTFEFKALFGWQYLFIEIDWTLPVFSVVKSDLVNRVEILKDYFPQNSYTQYIAKLK